jgi:hypothetical protein
LIRATHASLRAISKVIVVSIIVLCVAAAVVGVYGYESLNSHPISSSASFSQDNSNARYVYRSDINSLNPCGAWDDYNIGKNDSSFVQLLSNIETNPNFTSLEGNRTVYSYDGGGCGSNSSTNGTGSTVFEAPLSLGFAYEDRAHPFTVCTNSTAWPIYDIIVGVDLIPTGYDLGHSTYNSIYYGPKNTTVFCTTHVNTS